MKYLASSLLLATWGAFELYAGTNLMKLVPFALGLYLLVIAEIERWPAVVRARERATPRPSESTEVAR